MLAKSIICINVLVQKCTVIVILNRISGIMVIEFESSVVNRGFESGSGQTKDYEIGICCFSAKHVTLRSKTKDWLARIQDKMSAWGEMSIRGLLFN